MTRLTSGAVALATALSLFVLPAAPAAAALPHWDVTGDYTWLVLGTYEHDITIDSQNPDGTFVGHGGWPAGGPYQTTEQITGAVSGSSISLTTTYDGPYNPGYTVTATGAIALDGTISGTNPWPWEMTSGAASLLEAQTIVVSGNTAAGENQPGWLFNRDTTTATPFEFNDDAASIGEGSLYVLPIGATSSDKMIAENFLNTPIADVNSISYDFKIGAGGDASDKVQFYMNVYANFGQSDDLKYYDCRYAVVPTVGSTGGFTTVTFDPNQAYPVATRGGSNASPHTCPAIPADMDDLSAGSNIRMFALNVGDTSASDVGLDGYLDNVVVFTDDGATVYDFEPAPVAPLDPTDKDQCKKDGWKDFGFKNQGQCVRFVNTGQDSR